MLLNLIKPLLVAGLVFSVGGCTAHVDTVNEGEGSVTLEINVPDFDYAAVADAKISGVDVVFAEMMVPHHEQALVLAELAYKYAEDGRVIALAREIEETQDFEINLMNKWLDASGTVEKNQIHSEMKGMLAPEDFERLEGLRGNDFDVAWLEYMIEHHEGAVLMVDLLRFSNTEEVILFGEHVAAVQSEEIRLMQSILEEIR
jgi:uncharacterized protein (DUF305 family)